MFDPPPPLRRPISIHDLPRAGQPFRIEATPDERRAVAAALDLVALDRLQAEGVLRPQGAGGRVKLEGRLQADVVQTCVVTLDEVAATLDVPFEGLYASEAEEDEPDATAGGEVYLDLASDLPVEHALGDSVDVGAAVVEQLALDLDPYPRKQGALFTGCPAEDARAAGASDAAPDTGPLAQLAGWRTRHKAKGTR